MGDEVSHPGGLHGRCLSGGSEGPFADLDQADGGRRCGQHPLPSPLAPGVLAFCLSSGVIGDLPQF